MIFLKSLLFLILVHALQLKDSYICVYVFLMAVIHFIWNIMLFCCDVRYQAVAYIEASAYINQDGKVR